LPLEKGNFVLYNQAGQLIKQHNLKGRNGQIVLNAKELPAGMYLASISSGTLTTTLKLVVE